MKLKMHERSLFASLLRLPWWVSLVIGVVIALLSRLTLKATATISPLIALTEADGKD